MRHGIRFRLGVRGVNHGLLHSLPSGNCRLFLWPLAPVLLSRSDYHPVRLVWRVESKLLNGEVKPVVSGGQVQNLDPSG